MGHCSTSTSLFSFKESFSKPVSCFTHIGCCCTSTGYSGSVEKRSVTVNQVRNYYWLKDPARKDPVTILFILMYFDPSLPWAARSYLLIETWNRTWAKYKLVSSPTVGKLTVGCPWSAEGLDLSKPNSLLLEWISTSRCPRTTVMPRVRCTLSATRMPSIPVMR